ncbi:hypothetical protein GCM10020216_097250 [Nonomuraea helvata]
MPFNEKAAPPCCCQGSPRRPHGGSGQDTAAFREWRAMLLGYSNGNGESEAAKAGPRSRGLVE